MPPDGGISHFVCGEGGIRTRDTLSSIHTFQACSFNHSDTSPKYAGIRHQKNRRIPAKCSRLSSRTSRLRRLCVLNAFSVCASPNGTSAYRCDLSYRLPNRKALEDSTRHGVKIHKKALREGLQK